jgi:hypothetical protein
VIYSCYGINIVGSSGGAKAIVGKLNVKKLGYRYVELDQTQWKPNWTESTGEESFANLENSLRKHPGCWMEIVRKPSRLSGNAFNWSSGWIFFAG